MPRSAIQTERTGGPQCNARGKAPHLIGTNLAAAGCDAGQCPKNHTTKREEGRTMAEQSFAAILQRSLDKQKAKQEKNRRAMAEAVREIQARRLGLDVDPNEDREGIPWGGGR